MSQTFYFKAQTTEGLKLIPYTDKDGNDLMARAARRHAPAVVKHWSSLISIGKGLKFRKNGVPRLPYKHTIDFKVHRWVNHQGITVIFGPRSREAPHAHLPERGTRYRTRSRIGGRFKYVMTAKTSHHKFPRVLRTGQVIARRWQEQTISSQQKQFLENVIRDFQKSFLTLMSTRNKGISST